MNEHSTSSGPSPAPRAAKDWVKILSQYREAGHPPQRYFELIVTLGPFVALWALAWWSLSYSYWLTFAISAVQRGLSAAPLRDSA